VPRVLPEHLCARLERGSWRAPPLFAWLQEQGSVADAEMLRVFNCGIGMVAIVAERDAARASDLLSAAGETVWRIGVVDSRAPGEEQTVVA
jgi:phosphoribosylformylglycinamidine cyclo-ligase